jgi:hypothetical protein
VEEQVAEFVRVLEDYTFEEPDKNELLTVLQRQGTPSASAATNAKGSSSAAGGAGAASPNSKSQMLSPAASSSSFVRAGASPAALPARQQQNENAVAGRTYIKVLFKLIEINFNILSVPDKNLV